MSVALPVGPYRAESPPGLGALRVARALPEEGPGAASWVAVRAADERGVLLAVPLPYVALLGTAAIGTTLEDNAGDAQLTIARHNGLNASEATSAVK